MGDRTRCATASGVGFDQREQAGLTVASGGRALGRGPRILLQLEQDRLLHFRRCNQLFATALQKIAPSEAPAVNVDEFRYRHDPLLLFGCQRSAALHPCPSARPGVARGRGWTGRGITRAAQAADFDPGRGRSGYPGRSLPRARGGARSLKQSDAKVSLPSAREGRRPSASFQERSLGLHRPRRRMAEFTTRMRVSKQTSGFAVGESIHREVFRTCVITSLSVPPK